VACLSDTQAILLEVKLLKKFIEANSGGEFEKKFS
jgi:hypothetical protein